MVDAWWAGGLAFVITLFASTQSGAADTRMRIDTDTSKRRTCPSTECGVVGRFFLNESVPVYETVDGWSRVSIYYSAACSSGHSALVDSGPSRCEAANGITNGEFAEWVKSEFLTAEKAR
jgi:hypothetical protein